MQLNRNILLTARSRALGFRLAVASLTCVALGKLRASDQPGDFSQDIRPLLSQNCFLCHGPDEERRKADLRLDTQEGALKDLGGHAAVVPGKPEKSELFRRVAAGDPDDRMPPPESDKN